MTGGLIIAAPQSGSGKTVVTLGLARCLRRRGLRVSAAKAGPDYIDAGFLAAASQKPCRNLDPWAMRPETLAAQIKSLQSGADIVLCEGVMGLFDGAGMAGRGSTAELAVLTGWPVILVVNVEGQAHSVAALIEGFARHRAAVTIAGVIFNRVGSERHATLLSAALRATLPQVALAGMLPRNGDLEIPARHLGLVPASEHRELDAFLDRAGAFASKTIDIDALLALALPSRLDVAPRGGTFPTLGAHIAVARDDAFLFAYDSMLEAWCVDGSELSYFSPLANQPPALNADAVFLPGGYPELHAAQLAANSEFLEGLRDAAKRGATIYGECGGYMTLGRSLVDATGTPHEMAGLLPLETNFAARKLHLGYRRARLATSGPLGATGQEFRGHEFHYATVCSEGDGTPLFNLEDADGAVLGSAGRIAGTVLGSFVHLIDRAENDA